MTEVLSSEVLTHQNLQVGITSDYSTGGSSFPSYGSLRCNDWKALKGGCRDHTMYLLELCNVTLKYWITLPTITFQAIGN